MASGTKDGCGSVRNILWYLVFFGFAVNYMVRINLNIAIVDMVMQKTTVATMNNTVIPNECHDGTPPVEQSVQNSSANITYPQPRRNDERRFAWNEYQQGLILGAFFWFHWVTQIPGGLLSQRFGTKCVFGLSNLAGCLCCLAIPIASRWDYKWLIFVRAFQGLVSGFAWPAMHGLTAKWIPPNERGKFVTAYLGSSVGAALTYPLCGFLIAAADWPIVFYVSTVIGTIWFIFWWLLVFDSPEEHPRISEIEKEYILSSLGQSITASKDKAPTPWKAIITSVPIWMNILAQWGGVWGLFTLMTHAPTYFKNIHGWDIKVTGLLSGFPHLMRMLFAYVFSIFGDYLLRKNIMSTTNVRKLAAGVCTIGQGFCMLGLAFSGCNKTAAIVLATLATASHGAVSSGPLASFVDLSPNYASVTFGVCNTLVAPAGFLSAQLIGALTLDHQTAERWQWVFLISAAMTLVSGFFYVIFAKSELQKWNNPYQAVKQQEDIKFNLDIIEKKEKEIPD